MPLGAPAQGADGAMAGRALTSARMSATLRKLLVGVLLILGLTYFALVPDDASPEGLVLWSPEEAAAAELAAETPSETPATPQDGAPLTPDAMGDRPQVVHGRVVRADG